MKGLCFFKEKEIDQIKSLAPTHTVAEIARIIKRNHEVVRVKCKRLGIKTKPWKQSTNKGTFRKGSKIGMATRFTPGHAKGKATQFKKGHVRFEHPEGHILIAKNSSPRIKVGGQWKTLKSVDPELAELFTLTKKLSKEIHERHSQLAKCAVRTAE